MRTGSPTQAEFKGDAESEWKWFSLSDSMPGVSLNPERAARRIVAAIENGETRVVLGMPAKLAKIANQLSPALIRALLSGANRMLPKTAVEDATATSGTEVAGRKPDSWIRKLLYEPARKYNQPL
jgi:hypothetical protein